MCEGLKSRGYPRVTSPKGGGSRYWRAVRCVKGKKVLLRACWTLGTGGGDGRINESNHHVQLDLL